MTTWSVYRLEPASPFHFGERGVGVETTTEVCHADTLFSALCVLLAEVEGTGALLALLEEFARGDPPFLLSSAYPYAGDVLLLPRPSRLLPERRDREEGVEARSGKWLKQVQLVSWSLFDGWVSGQVLPEFDQQEEEPALIHGKRVWVAASERPAAPRLDDTDGRWWTVDVVPRVTVDRRTAASTIYHCGRLRFAPQCGLYFLAWWRRESWREVIERALTALGDAGLGGERSSGYGQFSWTPPAREVPLPAGPDAGGLATLAPYCPQPAELEARVLGPGASWELLPRFGWTSYGGRGVRRKSVTILAEGSTLRWPDGGRGWAAGTPPVLGRLVDVTPEGFREAGHAVYRLGIAFPWPARLNE